MEEPLLFALTESINGNQNWGHLLEIYMEQADFVEFNTLYDSHKLDPEIQSFKSDLVEEGRRPDKFYPSGDFHRYRLSERLKEFILSKPYSAWNNYQFEDLSLIKDGEEILITITHENYVFAKMTEKERNDLNKSGFEFGELHVLKK